MLRKSGPIIAIMVISVALFWVNAEGQSQGPSPGTRVLGSQQKSQTAKIKNNPQNDQRDTEQSPLIIKVAPSPNTQDEAAQAKKEKDEQATMNRGVEITTYIIAGAAGIQAIVLSWTLIVMIRTTRRQLRAYVFTESLVISNVANPLPEEGEIPEDNPAAISKASCGPIAFIRIKNSGKTPAYKVIHGGGIQVREFPLLSPLPVELPSGSVSEKTLPANSPSGDKTVIRETPLTVQEIAKLREGTLKIYVYGVIKYKDTFGKTRYTYYRFMHPGQNQRVGVSTSMTVCDEGNESN